jgi:mannose-6-phosphate isomerase
MALERASTQAIGKPWGRTDLRPWGDVPKDGAAVGELWFERAAGDAPEPALRLKLLFTAEPLSIQVHPDDDWAHRVGLPHGKTEAWYILAAQSGAEIAIGLKRRLSQSQLRASIEAGSIADELGWRSVQAGDVGFVPAGTIHTIGAGLVVAEIQQRSDATFRLFDHGRRRALQVDEALAVADAGPAESQRPPRRLSNARSLLVASPYFVLERIDLRPISSWQLRAESETWVLILEGHAQVGPFGASVGDVIFIEAERTAITAGPDGMSGLLAYVGAEPNPGLLRELAGLSAGIPIPAMER